MITKILELLYTIFILIHTSTSIIVTRISYSLELGRSHSIKQKHKDKLQNYCIHKIAQKGHTIVFWCSHLS